MTLSVFSEVQFIKDTVFLSKPIKNQQLLPLPPRKAINQEKLLKQNQTNDKSNVYFIKTLQKLNEERGNVFFPPGVKCPLGSEFS